MRIYSAVTALFLAGVGLALAFHEAPRFHDPDWRDKVPFGDSEAFFRAEEENRTLEGQLAELGMGMASLALSLAVGGVALGVRNRSTLRSLSTPSRWWVIVLLANLTLVGMLYTQWLGLLRDLGRGEYPSWGDSPGIPLLGFLTLGIVGIPIITAGLLVCLWRARLPAALWNRPIGWWPWLATVVIGLLLIIETVSLAGAVQVGNAFAVPFHVAALYWLLCGRAAVSLQHAA